MKFIKRKSIDNSNPRNNAWAVEADGTIVTDTKKSLQLPAGTTGERPDTFFVGQVRYNTDINEYEVYNNLGDGLGWERMRTLRPAKITVQNLGVGDYTTTVFGPLLYRDGTPYDNHTDPENIFVYIENVFQIPTTNYILIGGPGSVSIEFTSAPPNKTITAIIGYDGFWPAGMV